MSVTGEFPIVSWVGNRLESLHLIELQSIIPKSKTSRYCFHANENSGLHVMIIALAPSASYPIHKHEDTDEWYFILSGQLVINIFDDGLNLQNATILGKAASGSSVGTLGMLVQKKTWHDNHSGAEGCVFLEVRNGPFDKSKTSFASSR